MVLLGRAMFSMETAERVAKVQNVNVENKKNESSAPKNYPAGGDPYCLQKGQPRRYRGSVTTDPKPFGISVQRRGLPNRSSVKSRGDRVQGPGERPSLLD